MFRRLYLSRIFHILRDVMIKNPVTKLRIKWRRSSKSFKICASTLSFRDSYFDAKNCFRTIKSLLMNKEKLLELAKIPLNENCSAMLLKKLPEKHGDPGKFLIPCNFPTTTTLEWMYTTRYSSTYDDTSINRIDVIDVACEEFSNRIDVIDEIYEEYALELLGFSSKSSGGNPTLTSEPLTSEFILEEIKAYLKDDSISPKIDHADCDPEGDICLIE
ncbi:hypothetical protein Tco_1172484 [Tanacetum coccineum]